DCYSSTFDSFPQLRSNVTSDAVISSARGTKSNGLLPSSDYIHPSHCFPNFLKSCVRAPEKSSVQWRPVVAKLLSFLHQSCKFTVTPLVLPRKPPKQRSRRAATCLQNVRTCECSKDFIFIGQSLIFRSEYRGRLQRAFRNV